MLTKKNMAKQIKTLLEMQSYTILHPKYFSHIVAEGNQIILIKETLKNSKHLHPFFPNYVKSENCKYFCQFSSPS